MTELLINYISFSHLIEFTLAYFLLDQLYMQNKITYLLVTLALLFSVYIGGSFTIIDTLLLFIFFFFLSIKNSKSKNIIHSLLTVSIAYLLEIFTTILMRPLFLKSIESTKLTNTFFMFICIVVGTFSLIFLSSWYIRKWILSRINFGKKETALSYLLTLCLLAYQTYWLLAIYSSHTPLLKIFIIVFYAILIIPILSFIQTLKKNEELKFQAHQRKIEYDMMSKYAEEVKEQYQKIRKFRHDYVNILSSIENYLEQNKIEELKVFYHAHVKQTKSLFKSNMLRLDDLQKIEAIEIQSILATKLIMAQEKKIDVQIEVSENISKNIPIDPVILIRILGILLDNAIEELETLTYGKLLVGIFTINSDLVFIIQNNVREDIESVQLLKKQGYSTKGETRGIGLANVEELISLEPRLLLETTIKDKLFIQKIIIMKG